jgi:hypothetical protein
MEEYVSMSIWQTSIEETETQLSGPFRAPQQMLAEQEYDGHLSIHDDSQAESLGFKGAPIEGPTHFSQFDPLLHKLWGDDWFRFGCISTHFKAMVIEGESVKAYAERSNTDDKTARIWAVKEDGEVVLEGSASLGPNHPESHVEKILASRPTAENLVILEHAKIGDRSPPEKGIRIDFNQNLGKNYPFTLNQKLKKITECCNWYLPVHATSSPWGRPIVPFEMINPLVSYTRSLLPRAKQPSIGLFADLQVKLINGPILVNEEYILEREIVGLGESRRTESMWIKTSIFSSKNSELVGTVLLNNAVLKDSFPNYEAEKKLLDNADV